MFAARLMEQRLNADHSDCQGRHLPCGCGESANYAGRRNKTFTTALGEMTLHYHCDSCKGGFYPRDQALGLDGMSLSPAIHRMIGIAAARVSFAESSELLWELAGARIDAKQVERAAESLGRDIAADEQQLAEVEPNRASTLYLGMDGTGIPVRKSETAGRSGKQPDGSSKTREVKLVTVWSAEKRDRNNLPTTDPGSVSYCAAIESARALDTDPLPSAFAQRVEREATRRDFPNAKRQAVIADGARWIWNIAAELFPNAVQILDLYHAIEHLWDVAKVIYGADSELVKPWAEQQKAQLKKGHIDAIILALKAHECVHEEVRKCINYLDSNRDRMQYAKFRAMGLCVGSGVVESGCKNTIGARLKRSGMHWSVDGANAIIALRCCVLSNRFDDYWYRREL